ncbi:MAG TPA: hypothetical protein VM755_16610 [Stellaceae bacterium]|nr:hypothetical protein [Stellaceae bacterium]
MPRFRGLAWCLLGGVACFVAAGDPSHVQAATPPHLTDIVPASGPAGIAYPIRATIHGTGFMPKGNVVEFGPAKIEDVAGTAGGSLTFGVPKSLPSRGEVPPAVLPAGRYRVRVRTPSGTSNALIFTLTRGG